MKHFTLILFVIFGACIESYSQDGALDQSFGSGGIVISPITNGDSYHDVVVQDDNKIIAVGMSFDAGFVSRANVFRFLPDGSLDEGFADNGIFTFELNYEANIYSCAINSEGKIILAGSTTDYVNYKFLVIQLNADGSLDSSFGDNGVVVYNACPLEGYYENLGNAVAIDAEDKILVSGNSFDVNYIRRPVVLRFMTTGEIDPSFGNNGVATIPVGEGACSYDCLAIQPDGKIIAGGNYGNTLLWYVLLLTRFNSDGSIDTTFGEDGSVKYSYGDVDDEAFDLGLTSDGSIVVAGFTATQTYNFSTLVMQFTSDGTLDTNFGSDGIIEFDQGNYDVADALSILPDGKIVVAGTSGEGPPNSYDMAIWKYNPDGSPDLSFDGDGFVQHEIENYYAMGYGLAIQNDGKILIAGQARTNVNQNHYFISRLNNEIEVAVSEYQSDSIELYPNPCKPGSDIVFSANVEGPLDIVVFSALGVYVQHLECTQIVNGKWRTQIPQNLAEGIYILRIGNANEIWALRPMSVSH
jgi:uncharacterized delta-60 repeat protein